jgi:uncharacterized protein (DUF4415 family)
MLAIQRLVPTYRVAAPFNKAIHAMREEACSPADVSEPEISAERSCVKFRLDPPARCSRENRSVPVSLAGHAHYFRSEGRPRGTTSVSLVAPMKKRYDFSKSVKNPYLRKPKKQLTIRLDEDTIDYFRDLAEKNGIPYQNLINLYLRDCAQSDRKLSMKWE